MALIACPDCGRQVSDQALACPHCGRPLRSVQAPEGLRREARSLQSLTTGCGCLVLLFVLAVLGVIVFLVKHGVVDWKALFAYTIQRGS
jgi:4-hydroxy-3-methylbut-2-en-1-yl diphosphate synthase IspG/GcpE